METHETLLKRAHAMLDIGSRDGVSMAIKSLEAARREPPLFEQFILDFDATLADKGDFPLAYRAEALRLGTVAALAELLSLQPGADPWTRDGATEAAERLWLAIGSAEGLLAYAHSDASTLKLAARGLRNLIEGQNALAPCAERDELCAAIDRSASALDADDRPGAEAALAALRKRLGS